MEHKKFKALAMAGLLCCAINSTAQVTQLNNTVTLGTQYIGCDNLSSQPLRFTTVLNFPHEWRTANLLRMRLNHTLNYTIGAFANQNADGYLGLSPNASLWTAPSPGPFSRLHLHDGAGAPLQLSYRPWMDNGITFTTNNDHMYIGHKVEDGVDQTAAVIQKQRLRRPRSETTVG